MRFKKWTAAMVALALGFVVSCSSGGGSDPAPPQVHAAGYYAGAYGIAVYWKDDQAGEVELFPTADAQARSVFVYAGDVYVAGYFTNSKLPSGNKAAGYWKNGVLVSLYSDTVGTNEARANSIYVDATGVYVAGFYNDGTKKACYWKDGAKTDLYTIADSEGLGITVSSSNVYVAGYYNNSTYDIACYWLNTAGGKIDLYPTGSSRARSVAFDGTNVHVAGSYVSAVSNACFWTYPSAVRTELGSPAIAESIALSGTDVYVAGYFLNAFGNLAACTWKNNSSGQVTLYSDTVTAGYNGHAYSVFVYNGDVYAAGDYSEGTQTACYWKNGTRTNLHTTAVSTAFSIKVSE